MSENEYQLAPLLANKYFGGQTYIHTYEDKVSSEYNSAFLLIMRKCAKKAYVQARAGTPFEKIFPKFELWGTNGD